MQRREFLLMGAGAIAVSAIGCGKRRGPTTARRFHARRRFVETTYGRIAYVQEGTGPAALFLHGYPLNGYQWRGAIDLLSAERRCLAPDFLGLGYTEAAADQNLSPVTQADMLAEMLDAEGVDTVDLVANDSGGAVAQLFMVRRPGRVRTVLLTNCDVHENSPPAGLGPFLDLAKPGVAADQWLVPQLRDPDFARSPKGLGDAYTDPANLTDESIDYYFTPLVSSALRKAQFNQYAVAFEPNPLPAIEQALRASTVPARMLWGTGDRLFDVSWAEWLDRTLPQSRGVRRVEGAKLFFPEEMPDLIAQEARGLWQS
jgi:haloalkane dehalogenase